MATTYTENYHLGKQEDRSDRFNMKVITDNMDIIDSELANLNKKIDDSDAECHYSTEEKKVGTWIDGNELFRRTIVATVTITSADQWAVIEAITGINVFKISGVAVGNKGLSIPLSYTFSVDSNAQTFSLYIFNNEIRYDAKRIDNDTYTLYITIEYTKSEVT